MSCTIHLYNIYIIFCTNPFVIYIIFELNIPFDIFIKWAWCAYCVVRRGKNIRSRILCRIAPIDSKRATDCIRAIFRAFTARKPPGVHVTKRKMYRACAVMERYWRNKRTGADDWPITRWPRYLRWYWLGHWMSVQPQTSNASAPRTSSSPILPGPDLTVVRPFVLRSLCHYLILYPSHLPDFAYLPHAMFFPVTLHDEIGFMALFSSFVDNIYRQIARRKSAAPLLRRNNGVHSPLRVVNEKP